MTPAQIKSARLGLGLTAKALGEIMGMDQNSIYRVESGSRVPPARYLRVLELLALLTKNNPSP